MNPSSLIAVIEAIAGMVDKIPDASEYGTITLGSSGRKVEIDPSRLADEEIEAIKWGMCGALAGIASLLKGEENGNGVARITGNMFLAAVVSHTLAIDEDES